MHMQGSHTKHTCPHARRGGHLAANPKKVPGLTRPPSRRFAWAFAGLGCSVAGMRVSLQGSRKGILVDPRSIALSWTSNGSCRRDRVLIVSQ